MAATMKLSLTFVLLLSGLVVFGDAQGTCETVRCIPGGYITCKNYPGQKFNECACVCAPKDAKDCVLYPLDGSPIKCTAPNY